MLYYTCIQKSYMCCDKTTLRPNDKRMLIYRLVAEQTAHESEHQPHEIASQKIVACEESGTAFGISKQELDLELERQNEKNHHTSCYQRWCDNHAQS